MTLGTRKGITAYWTPQLQEWIASLCCIAMIAGMLFSRAVLSIAMIVLMLNALHPQKVRQGWTAFKKSRFAICCVLFFTGYLISGLWSTDMDSWLAVIQTKLPFIFLPFPMLNTPFADDRFRKFTTGGILVVLLAGMLYSFYPLITDPGFLLKGYHLPSPLEGDYIRFTIVLVFGIQFVFWFFLERRKKVVSKKELLLPALWALLAVVYIHIQAAKSGLMCFYALLIIFTIFLFKGKRRWIGFAIWAGIAAIATMAVFLVPAMNKQLENALYEQKVWNEQDKGKYTATYSFVPRLISYKLASEVILHHPLIGVGAGDMDVEMSNAYEKDYAQIPERIRLLPHNQFMCTALAVGLPLSLSLLGMVFSPLFDRRKNIFVISTALIMLLGLMIEPMLETQYGIFVFLFFTLFWMEVPLDRKT